ncbi:phosphoribosylformylglycinamidine cyclo-ligase [Solidesulfovibrio carbinoliphilus subsp. oakridgensis]|uniref:Phosphoribosylformylglycinamidine cyclo-ligase n=1 Tax=Solidesulfovibrio carbinoliphilus subsp. oakridgensis TaxID=694327 RepID=G7Q4U0_9BACT|nr:phosphoribosylformylglycinamidine cyclo-ligase [Solidesulfovibrio carbinoliphilus]EHJ47550.1 phosphoribosylformylglycinamidine cyclo-ligase [Solidesulfovibrio carbinoliphilus subsp. oakridgensis]
MADRSAAYKAAGVDIDAGNSLVSRIKSIVAGTYGKGVVSDIGGFGGLFKLDSGAYTEPVLVSSTDGVGTKLKLAHDFARHDTIGIDLVAMCVNDILVQGAKPLFFLDYFATGKLSVDLAATVVSGIADGCKEAGCALLGGETAEMPGFYPDGMYDLAGFSVGIVDNAKIIDGSSIGVGDAVIGIEASGPHSNGYSLIRKILAESGLGPDDPIPHADKTVAEALLAPTRIYVKTVLNLLRDFDIKGMVHITGGGFYDNVNRILPKGVAAHIRFGSWEVPQVFEWLKTEGRLTWPEMLQIFNCGIGFMLVVAPEIAGDVVQRLKALHEYARVIGQIEIRKDGAEQVEVTFPAERP